MVDHLIARARAKVLNNDINGRKPEVKVVIGKDVYINVRWKGSEVVESMVKCNRRGNQRIESIMDTGCGHDLISKEV